MVESSLKKYLKEFQQDNLLHFNEFYESTKKAVFYNILSFIKSHETSEDILQDTYVKFLKHVKEIKSHSSILGYLIMISKNLSLDYLKKIKDLQEALLRTQADNVNYRKRKDEEVAKRLEYANEDLVKEILPVVDNFERAISLDDDNLDDELSKFLQGFKMIYCHLVDILNKYDVKAIDGANKPFDPKYHQAVLTEKVDGMESGMVIEVMQKGYLFKDKVIRPAMVKVSE